MASFHFIKTLDSLVPSDQRTKDKMAKIKNGQVIKATGMRIARNPKFHRLVFALLGVGFDNQDHYTDPDAFRRYIKYQIGSVESFFVDGKTHIIPLDWDFDSMDDLEFKKFYIPLYAEIHERVLGGVKRGALDEAVLERVRGFKDTEARARNAT